MEELDYIISHPVGLYAKVAEGLVKIANEYESEVFITYKSKQVNMKSLMGVISLGVPCNGKIHLCIKGKDAKNMKDQIEKFFVDMRPFFLFLDDV